MLAVLTTVYPAALPFLDDFLEGLQNQSDSNFTLFIVNDGVEGLEDLPLGKNFDTRILKASGTPAALRRQGIDWVTQDGAEWVVFADSDDICASERVAKIRARRNNADGLFNDLLTFGSHITQEKSLLSPRFKAGDAIRPDALVNVNFLGMTNTAAKAKLLKNSAAQIPDDVIAFDWALFTLIALNGAAIRYMDGAPTRYRQHDNNVAGPCNVSDQKILKGVEIKSRHYDLFCHKGDPYDRLATDFEALKIRLNTDAQFLRDYCRAVRVRAGKIPLWWQPMKLPEELGL